nr:hypothetical protein Iba_scaffold29759CG0090 [Ipomoea batatas]GMD32026.1 hypothetical protein Iba_chr09bCG4340 [Ipomoea batatas]
MGNRWLSTVLWFIRDGSCCAAKEKSGVLIASLASLLALVCKLFFPPFQISRHSAQLSPLYCSLSRTTALSSASPLRQSPAFRLRLQPSSVAGSVFNPQCELRLIDEVAASSDGRRQGWSLEAVAAAAVLRHMGVGGGCCLLLPGMVAAAVACLPRTVAVAGGCCFLV